jgi:hypothetical protein
MLKANVSAAGGAMPAEGHKPETYASGFLRLMALRQAIEKTLGEMAALLGDDAPEGVAIAVRAPVGGNQRRGRA